jgi:hypothetical protein
MFLLRLLLFPDLGITFRLLFSGYSYQTMISIIFNLIFKFQILILVERADKYKYRYTLGPK